MIVHKSIVFTAVSFIPIKMVRLISTWWLSVNTCPLLFWGYRKPILIKDPITVIIFISLFPSCRGQLQQESLDGWHVFWIFLEVYLSDKLAHDKYLQQCSWPAFGCLFLFIIRLNFWNLHFI